MTEVDAHLEILDKRQMRDARRSIDPCNCLDLRSRLATQMRQAVSTLRNSMRHAVVDTDMLSLASNNPVGWQPNMRAESFEGFCHACLRTLITNAGRDAMGGLRSAYDRGLKAARAELGIVNGLPGSYMINNVATSLGADIVAIAEVTKASLVRAGVAAIIGQDRPTQAYHRMNNPVIKRITGGRLDTMAATLVTAGYNMGKLDVYENAGRLTVEVIAETHPNIHRHEHKDAISVAQMGRIAAERREKWATGERERVERLARAEGTRRARAIRRPSLVEIVTAGDDRVCSICEELEGQTYTLSEARELIPAHPRCRCSVTLAT